MILLICQYLAVSLGVKIAPVFLNSSTRMMLAALSSLLLTILWGPWWIKKLYELKTGQSIRVEDCPMLAELHKKKKDTPTMGGIFILFAMLVSMFLWMDLKSSFTGILLITTLFLGILGGWDDYLKMRYKNSKGISARKKFLLQIALGALIALYLYCPEISQAIHRGEWFASPLAKEQILLIKQMNGQLDVVGTSLSSPDYMSRFFLPFLKDPILILQGSAWIFGMMFVIFVIVGSSNAVNLTDGLDGLASGCLVMVAAVLALFAFFSNNIEMARYLNILYTRRRPRSTRGAGAAARPERRTLRAKNGGPRQPARRPAARSGTWPAGRPRSAAGPATR
ncbi:MAG: hypothetical protein HYZ48_03390 [Chlamydiales bacterium]|nr:hypothetical protein [Chlamydiales bacterium]